MKRELVTIIIPVYNNCKNLRRCMDSAINQTYTPKEIILVDDGSTDGTSEICDIYAKHEEVKVIHIQNSGVSAARNKALDVARGKYICYLDSDDYLDADCLSSCVEKIKDVDQVSFGSYFEFNDGAVNKIRRYSKKDKQINIRQVMTDRVFADDCFCTVWGNLYKADLIRTIRFDTNLKNGEDFLYNIQCLLKAKSVYFIGSPLYHYVMTENGATRSGNPQKIVEMTENAICATNRVAEELRKQFRTNFEKTLKIRRVVVAGFKKSANILNYSDFKKAIAMLRDSNIVLDSLKEFNDELGFLDKLLMSGNLIGYILQNIGHRMSQRKRMPQEQKKRIFLESYIANNLGDDLIVKSLCDRYPQHVFYNNSYINTRNLNIDNLKNVKVPLILKRAIRKASIAITKKDLFRAKMIRSSDLAIVAGGSMFIEDKNKETCIKFSDIQQKPYYIIGANIGPVYTDDYSKKVADFIKKSQDTCLRDRKSVELARKYGASPRLSTDIVFGANIFSSKSSIEKKVIISPIDLERKIKQTKDADLSFYYLWLEKVINYYNQKDYQIELMSFCGAEGDEDAIRKLIAKYPKISFKTYLYDGKVDEAVEEIKSCEVVVAVRYHALILGLMTGKTVVPIIYNDKMRNTLEDINFQGLRIDLENSSEKVNIYDLNKQSPADYDITSQRLLASEQFSVLDKVLK